MPTLIVKTFESFLTAREKALSQRKQTSSRRTQHITQKHETDNKSQQQWLHSTTTTQKSWTATPSIWEAAEQGDIETVRHYLDNASTTEDRLFVVNARDPLTDATLLHLVLTNTPVSSSSSSPSTSSPTLERRLELVTLILNYGANPAATNVYNIQAIHLAPLHVPTMTLPFLDVLLAHGANVNARDGDGWTPLHYAARFCQPPLPVMQTLIAHGADVNAADDTNHKTCLYSLIASGDHVDCLRWIIHSTKYNIQSRGDFHFYPVTPIHLVHCNNADSELYGCPTKPPSRLNSTKGSMKKATLILQAVKYGRVKIFRYLTHDRHIMDVLKPLLSLDEIIQARYVVKQQVDASFQPEHAEQLALWKSIDKELEYLTTLLEQNSRRVMVKEDKKVSTPLLPSSTPSLATTWATAPISTRHQILLRNMGKLLARYKRRG